ncbi:hypothetical protein L1077_23840 [Pseudoalteromonas luteoviolacea]|uniref:hypothetical protein n=1 Tax=Pseudoalteromonas luteoviolacea TaxID=43657 RepID=UPI001F3759DD|nr:hypothetical protein [Pseudoalteromonas luteoviolacea]MCF6442465.1 hypothetical protein [Pseudoalteromonas luteoviolacea]
MIKNALILTLGLGVFTLSAQAAVVECIVSGTPTPQEYTADFCSSAVSSTASSVRFRLVTSKPIAEVSWTYSGSSGRWNCGRGQYCTFSNYNDEPSGGAQACARRVLYKDGTWENINACAYGMFWYGSGPVIPFTDEASSERIN